MKAAPPLRLEHSTIFRSPNVFLDKKGFPVIVRAFEPRFLPDLTAMYLAYTPRASIGGVPPARDSDCIDWVRRLTTGSAGLIAISFAGQVIGHAVLLPMKKKICELLIVIAPLFQKSGIGTQMMHGIVQLGFELGFSKIWLSVHKTNFVALHLYNKSGFECLSFTDSPQIDMALDLKRFHPTARIRVAEAMNQEVITIGKDAPCRKAVEVFLQSGVEALPVVDGGNALAGIVSQTDLMFKPRLRRPVGDIATREVVTLHEHCTLDKAIRLLQKRNLRSIPVLDAKRRVVGIISRRDILAHFFKTGPQR